MNALYLKILAFIALAPLFSLKAATVSSSSISTSSPLSVTEDTTIMLTSDITISSGTAALIEVGGSFGSSENVVNFNSSTGNKVIIQNGATWDPSTFTSSNHIIRFSGNAQLVCEQGATIVVSSILHFIDTAYFIQQHGTTIQFNGGTLRMDGNTTLTTQVP